MYTLTTTNPVSATAGNPCPLALIRAAGLLENHRGPEAAAILGELADASSSGDGRDLQTLIFACALLRNLGTSYRAEQANLYLQQFELPQIELFNLLSRHVPLVAQSGRLVNGLIADHLAEHPESVLMDVGIGTGRQELALLDDLAERGIGRLTLIGIEPAAEALDIAHRSLLDRGAVLGVRVEFIPIPRCIEDFVEADWRALEIYRGRLIVNEAFSLHHVTGGSGGENRKNAVLRRLRSLEPRLFILTEPHADHQQPGLVGRLREAWRHFGLTFRFLDGLDSLSDYQKSTLKTRFFAREIEDILTLDDDRRVERHERAEQWISRLRQSDFHLLDLKDRVGAAGLRYSGTEEYLALGLDEQPIVAIIGAQGLKP